MSKTSREVDKIRPKALHDRALLLRKQCGEAFFQEHHADFVETPCPACKNVGENVFHKYGFTHKKCPFCSTLYCSPRPTEQLIESYYATSEATEYWTELLVRTDNVRKALQYLPRVTHLVQILQKDRAFRPGCAVDLGAGSGAFALALFKTGFFKEVLAVDFSEKCCEACEEAGLETKKGSVETLAGMNVSLITMNDMIEHLFDPGSFLSACHDALDQNGYISIACPNGEGFDFQIMQEKTVNITPPEHLNYFNPRSITMLLESVGFEIISMSTPGILDLQIVARAFFDGVIDLKDNAWMKAMIIREDEQFFSNFQHFLQENNCSSHMVVIAKKR